LEKNKERLMKMFCGKCGRVIEDNENKCPYCGSELNDENIGNNENISDEDYEFDDTTFDAEKKSIVVAGLLQIFLGVFGVGRIYLGYYKMGIIQIVVSLFTFFIGGAMWGFIDGIRILCGKVPCDANGRELSR